MTLKKEKKTFKKGGKIVKPSLRINFKTVAYIIDFFLRIKVFVTEALSFTEMTPKLRGFFNNASMPRHSFGIGIFFK